MNKNIMKISFFVMLLLGIAIQMSAMTLVEAIKNNDLVTVKQLVKDGINVNSEDECGDTPLHWAVLESSIEIVKCLVEKGRADINPKDKHGWTPLHHAAWNGNLEIVQYLIEKGARIHAQDNGGKTPLYRSVYSKTNIELGTMDLGGRPHSYTFYRAKNLDIAKYLIKKGADINAKSKNGRTLLHRAISTKSKEIIKWLTAKEVNVNSKDKDGWTPLHYAADWGDLEVVKSLVEKGADVNAKDELGRTAFHIVCAEKNRLLDWVSFISTIRKNPQKNFAEIANLGKIAQYLFTNGAEIPVIKKSWKNSLLDSYLFAPEYIGKYILQRTEYIQFIKPQSYRELSANSFEINSANIIEKFNHKLESELVNRLSIHKIIKKEKEIIKKGNYSIAHGRSTKFDRFINDQSFLYLMDIFYLFAGNNKEIDKNCHYTQHYAFPGEKWEEIFISREQMYDFTGLTINLPQNEVVDLVKMGITSSEELSYKRSTLQFGAIPLGTKSGSSPFDYVLSNGNVDETRGSVTIETLFKRLGKMIGKDLSNYYTKYKTAFDLICKAGEKFEHGTLLLYEFTPKALQEYVKVTHSSGGHINNSDSGILIKGKRTTDPKKVLDTLINNPEDFDEPTKDYEFFWPLTDEVTANMHSNEVKTYAFHIGKHDEMLAKNIKHWIAKVFERIKCDMAQDGIIKYDFMNKSKL